MENLKALCYQLRKDTVDIIMSGATGHIGGDMSVMEILADLYFKQMNVSPDKADDPDRDYFIMSKGHSMEAYYAVLCAAGFLDLQDVTERYSKFGSPYIGHPHNELKGIEMNSGSLGHGLPVSVGLALAAKMSKIDRNRLQISGSTEDVMALDDLAAKVKAFNWNVICVEDGNDLDQIDAALEQAKACKGMPTCIIANTIKGKGSPVMENQAGWHHHVPTQEEYEQIMKDLNTAKEALS